MSPLLVISTSYMTLFMCNPPFTPSSADLPWWLDYLHIGQILAKAWVWVRSVFGKSPLWPIVRRKSGAEGVILLFVRQTFVHLCPDWLGHWSIVYATIGIVLYVQHFISHCGCWPDGSLWDPPLTIPSTVTFCPAWAMAQSRHCPSRQPSSRHKYCLVRAACCLHEPSSEVKRLRVHLRDAFKNVLADFFR